MLCKHEEHVFQTQWIGTIKKKERKEGREGGRGAQEGLRTLLAVVDMFIILIVVMVSWCVHISKLIKLCILWNVSYILIKL